MWTLIVLSFFYDLNSKQRNTITFSRGRNNNVDAADVDTTSSSSSSSNSNSNNNNRLSWPQFYQQRTRGHNLHPNNMNSKKCDEDAVRPTSTGKFDRVLCPDEARVMQKANQIVMYVPLFVVVVVVVVMGFVKKKFFA